MDATSLSKRLIAAETKQQRKRLIAQHCDMPAVELARVLKDICVENWAARPDITQKTARVLGEMATDDGGADVGAYHSWAEGIASMTRGRLEDAVDRLEDASRAFARGRRMLESAQPQVAEVVALAMLGRYDRIPPIARRALRILEENGDQLSAGKFEINLSNVASRLGRHRRAESLGLSALRRFKSVNATAWKAMAENGLAITYTELNDFRTAEKFFRDALASARSTGMAVTEAEIEASIGNLELFRGRYAEALYHLELSRSKFDELAMPHKSAVADLEIAEIYAELNLTAEATELFRGVVRRLGRLKMPSEEARARLGFGRTATRLKKFSLARRQFELSAELYQRERNPGGRAAVTLHRALLELSFGDGAAAGHFARRAAAVFKRTGNLRLLALAEWLIGEVGANISGNQNSLLRLRRSLDAALRLEQTQIALLSLNSIGKAEAARGNAGDAKKAFRRAIALTERSRGPLPGEEFRMAFLEGKLEPFEELARMSIAEGDAAGALAYLERAKSRTLLESINADGPSAAAASPEARQLREELNWLYNRLRNADASERLQNDIGRRERQLSAVMRREASLARTGHGRREGVRPGGLDISELQASLGDGRALIEFACFNEKLSAFVVTGDGVRHVGDLCREAAVARGLEELQYQFGSMRYGKAALGAFAGQLKQRTDDALAGLYAKLLEPLEPIIGGRDLVIVPTGVVHYVPFAGLRDGSGYVASERSVSTAPSAAIWQALSCRPAAPITDPLLIAFADAAAPESESEAASIAAMFPRSTVLAGQHATLANFRAEARPHDLLHFACHGLFRADNPLYSSLALADGRITVRDISAERLNAQLVVLSACETGLNRIFPGEEIVGLARGFISAGARSMVLSLWTVSDEATRRLMTRFYTFLQRGESVPASLRAAQAEFIEAGEHPYYWSSFFSIG